MTGCVCLWVEGGKGGEGGEEGGEVREQGAVLSSSFLLHVLSLKELRFWEVGMRMNVVDILIPVTINAKA